MYAEIWAKMTILLSLGALLHLSSPANKQVTQSPED